MTRRLYARTKIGGVSRTFKVNLNRPGLRLGTLMEKRLVRTSTLATLVPVTIAPDQRWPRRTSSEENRMPRMRGRAALGSIGGVGKDAKPTATFGGGSGSRDAQAGSNAVNASAPTRCST